MNLAPLKELTQPMLEAMTENDARNFLMHVRWSSGKPTCPRCEDTAPYYLSTRGRWTCRCCMQQFYLWTGTPLTHCKMTPKQLVGAMRMLLAAGNDARTILAASHDLGVQYKTLWVLNEKLHDIERGNMVSVAKGYWQRSRKPMVY